MDNPTRYFLVSAQEWDGAGVEKMLDTPGYVLAGWKEVSKEEYEKEQEKWLEGEDKYVKLFERFLHGLAVASCVLGALALMLYFIWLAGR